MKYNSKKFTLLFFLIISCTLVISWYSPNENDDRNLKVLPKDISSDSLQKVMDDFTVSLNVSCSFCHAPKDSTQPKKLSYASDANPIKDITRTMMRMTDEMNTKYLKHLNNTNVQLVSCNTCHRGQPVPEIK
jgi:hypothetical protein